MREVDIRYHDLEDRLADDHLTDQEIQQLFDTRVTMWFYNHHNYGNYPLLMPLTRSLLLTGMHFKGQFLPIFMPIIKKDLPLGVLHETIPSGSQQGERHYFFHLSRHLARIQKSVQSHPELKRFLRNPVEKIAGPGQIPTTTQLTKSGEYHGIAAVFTSQGIDFRRNTSQVLATYISDDCPVPVFHYDNYYLPDNQRIEFEKYLARKKSQL